MGLIDSLKSILKLNISIPQPVKTQIIEVIKDEKKNQNIFEIIAQNKKENAKVNLDAGIYIIGTMDPRIMHFRFEVSNNSEITKVQTIHDGQVYSHESNKNLYSESIAFIINGDNYSDYHWIKL